MLYYRILIDSIKKKLNTISICAAYKDNNLMNNIKH